MKQKYVPSVASVIVASLYMLLTRVLDTETANSKWFSVMTIGFIFLGPFAAGFLTTFPERDQKHSRVWIFFAPWIPVTLGVLAAFALRIEGLICAVMFLPLAWICASAGGIAGACLFRKSNGKMVLASVLIFPLASQFIETSLPSPKAHEEIANEIQIMATTESVWNEIKSVRTISRGELAGSWVHAIGFPRPLDAEIDKEAVGGVRLARFERGLVFRETVTEWKVRERLAFDIKAEETPATALDQHVTIGGPYFDVLSGVYEMVPNEKGVLLKLRSRFRLSTKFNAYSALWIHAVMSRIQSDILSVVKSRAELSPHAAG